MGLVEFITKLFGNKSQKDMREIMPYVEKIKVVFDQIDLLNAQTGTFCEIFHTDHLSFAEAFNFRAN